IMAAELISSNLEPIILALGLQDYFRLGTLEDGSGRYFAWQFAWEHIQRFFVFGGGFANDETIMRKWRVFLEKQGHQGGVHNSYLSLWLDTGIVGLLIYLRSFFLVFIKASKLVPMSTAVLFSCLFSFMYESWLVGSLNPYTIVLLMTMTVVTEPEIANWKEESSWGLAERENEESDEEGSPAPVPVTLPA
ncbi:MAG TPA: O-antigen ligase family protein, partial [Flavobacteriales bacterium]|nr:O-antigen ligase family protein [Flavobacteriales bacterium]